jgi:hypothetical protein
MLTQKSKPPQGSLPKIKAEILVEGFVPSRGPQDRFDVTPTYKAVVDYLKAKGFRVEHCADYAGQEFHGGDLSGSPWNSCQFDVFTDAADPLQAKLSTVLRILTDAIGFRATAVFRRIEPISDNASRLRTVYFSYENPAPELALEFLKFAEAAESISVEFRHGGKRGTFTL